jgi:hypothetical protein
LRIEIAMLPPDCPDHGSLALELALGRLDDRAAAAAERARASCDRCSSWWHAQLEGETAARVDRSVAAAVGRFRPPRRHRWRYAAAAAAALAVAAAALLWRLALPAPVPSTDTVALVEDLFAGGTTAGHDLTGDGAVDASDLVASLRNAAAHHQTP